MSREYGAVKSNFWDWARRNNLSPEAKTIALYLLTCSHSTSIGCFRIPLIYIAYDTGYPMELVNIEIQNLTQSGFIKYSRQFEYVLITNYIQEHPPQNNNQIVGRCKKLAEVPVETGFVHEIAQEMSKHSANIYSMLDKFGLKLEIQSEQETVKEPIENGCETVSKPIDNSTKTVAEPLANPLETVSKPFGNPSETVSEPFRNSSETKNQYQYQNQYNIVSSDEDTSDLSESDPQSPKPPNCPHQEIIDQYHRILPSLARVCEWSESRKRLLRARWKENIERQSLDWWEKFFKRVGESDFLMGRAKDFMADLEWLVRPKNFGKILNGRYDNRSVSGGTNPVVQFAKRTNMVNLDAEVEAFLGGTA
jgi:hypothetical protein